LILCFFLSFFLAYFYYFLSLSEFYHFSASVLSFYHSKGILYVCNMLWMFTVIKFLNCCSFKIGFLFPFHKFGVYEQLKTFLIKFKKYHWFSSEYFSKHIFPNSVCMEDIWLLSQCQEYNGSNLLFPSCFLRRVIWQRYTEEPCTTDPQRNRTGNETT
jgi:hypothetical protein